MPGRKRGRRLGYDDSGYGLASGLQTRIPLDDDGDFDDTPDALDDIAPEVGEGMAPTGRRLPPRGTGLKIGRAQGANAARKKPKKKTGNPVVSKKAVSKEDVADSASDVNASITLMLNPEERRRRRRSMPGMGGMVGTAESMQ